MPAEGGRRQAHDLARHRHAWCAAGRREGEILSRHDARPAVLPQLPRVHRSGRPAACRSRCRYGQVNHLAFGPGERDADRPQHRRPGALEALSRRHGGPSVDRCRRAAASFRRMTELAGNVTSPMWIGRPRLLPRRRRRRRQPLLVPARRRRLRRHTDHDDFYARHAQSDGKRIVYQCGARHLAVRSGERLDAPDRRAHPRPSRPGGAQVRRRRRAPRIVPRASGRPSLAVDARGKLFAMALWEGAVRRFAEPEARPLPARPLARRRLEPRRRERRLGRGARRRLRRAAARARCRGTSAVWSRLRAAPQGTRVAIANHRNEVLLGDVASGELVKIDAQRVSAAATTSPGRPMPPGSPIPSRRARATSPSSCTRSPRARARC